MSHDDPPPAAAKKKSPAEEAAEKRSALFLPPLLSSRLGNLQGLTMNWRQNSLDGRFSHSPPFSGVELRKFFFFLRSCSYLVL
jgi:hypothetical protein